MSLLAAIGLGLFLEGLLLESSVGPEEDDVMSTSDEASSSSFIAGLDALV